jgi:glycosyltransferase involved in cell wall biosynthesis
MLVDVTGRKLRIALISSHPVAYHVAMYRELASRPNVAFEVLYTHNHGVNETFDVGFGHSVKFDFPLLEGYVHRFPKNISLNPGLTFAGQINPELPIAVVRGRYDAVIVHGYQNVTTLATLTTPRKRGTKILFRGESVLLNPKRTIAKRFAKQILLRTLFSRVDHFLAIGTLSRDYFAAYGASADRITIAPYTVDNLYFYERSADARKNPDVVRRKLGLPLDRPIYLYCSKIIARKRPLDVLRAFARARMAATAALVFVGSGDQLSMLQSEAIKLRIEGDVHFLGFRNTSELPEIYGACDVFVLASEREPWGMVVNEAMACGMAICTSDQVGSAYDLVRDNGAMFPVGDIERLADLMVRWAGNREEIERMKRASEKLIRTWSPKHSADGVIAGVTAALQRTDTTGHFTQSGA